MPTYDASQAECLVYTFKEGLLSKIAHDLKLRVERFTLTVEAERIEATFDAGSLAVVCAQRDGAERPGTLGRLERATIEGNVRKDVLRTKKHPQIRFVSTSLVREGDRAHVEGTLTLCGVARNVALDVERDGDHWAAEARLYQPDFGIKPYSAMLGTLKIRPDVRVRVRVPAA